MISKETPIKNNPKILVKNFTNLNGGLTANGIVKAIIKIKDGNIKSAGDTPSHGDYINGAIVSCC
jgi:hypothetical protein